MSRQKELAGDQEINPLHKETRNGAWLSAVPHRLNGTEFSREDFRDNLRLRYGLMPQDIPAACDGWGNKLSIKHREEPPRRESTSYPLATLEVLYALSADNWGSSIPKPPCFTLWPRICQKSALISSPPNSAGDHFSLRAPSIGLIRVPTPWTILCRYCHLSCNDIPKLA